MGSSHSAVPDASPVAEVGQEWRQKANEHAQRRNQYYQESQEAYQRKEGARAKELSLLGKEEERKMHEANQSAVQVIFESNNRTRPPNEIDLHGLFVKEAVEVMRKKLEESKRNGVKSLVVIVGRGNHSQNGIQKLKPAIEQLIQEFELFCMPNTPNPGCLYVEFGKKGGKGFADICIIF